MFLRSVLGSINKELALDLCRLVLVKASESAEYSWWGTVILQMVLDQKSGWL